MILNIAALLASLALLIYVLRRRPKPAELPAPDRFYVRTGEGAYLTASGLRRGPLKKGTGGVIAPPFDALHWPSRAEAEIEMKSYYTNAAESGSTISRVNLYIEREGDDG